MNNEIKLTMELRPCKVRICREYITLEKGTKVLKSESLGLFHTWHNDKAIVEFKDGAVECIDINKNPITFLDSCEKFEEFDFGEWE